MKLDSSSLEAKIVKFLREIYPVTLRDIRREFRQPKGRLDLALKRLEQAGIIELEFLPDRTYVRLVKAVGSVGNRPVNGKAIKHEKGRAKPRSSSDGDSVMYG